MKTTTAILVLVMGGCARTPPSPDPEPRAPRAPATLPALRLAPSILRLAPPTLPADDDCNGEEEGESCPACNPLMCEPGVWSCDGGKLRCVVRPVAA